MQGMGRMGNRESDGAAMSLTQWLFGCHHHNVSFPQTRDGETTVSCLGCGRRFLYLWEDMRMGDEVKDGAICGS